MHLWKCFLSGIMFVCVSVGGIYGVFACDVGEYDNGGVCETCPGGYSCDGTNAPQLCPDDAPYSDSTYTQCVACDGLTKYHDNNNVCQTCESGKFANTNHNGCVACNAGHYMLNGVCEQCPAGSYCNGDGNINSCQGAEISDAGAVQCTQCDGETPYSNSDHTQCVVCDGLTEYYDNNNVCQTCATGNFANAEHNDCIACNTGHYMLNGVCEQCPAGSYCSGNGMSIACSVGTCSWAGAESCVSCLAGYYCPNTGMTGSNRNNSCKPNSVDNNDYICPIGTFSGTGASSCISCPSGTTTNGTGKTKADDCKAVSIKLSFGNGSNIEIPSVLTVGRINTRVVKNVSENN